MKEYNGQVRINPTAVFRRARLIRCCPLFSLRATALGAGGWRDRCCGCGNEDTVRGGTVSVSRHGTLQHATADELRVTSNRAPPRRCRGVGVPRRSVWHLVGSLAIASALCSKNLDGHTRNAATMNDGYIPNYRATFSTSRWH
jgi:hypothetical protein